MLLKLISITCKTTDEFLCWRLFTLCWWRFCWADLWTENKTTWNKKGTFEVYWIWDFVVSKHSKFDWDMILWKIMVFCLQSKLVLDSDFFRLHPVLEVLQVLQDQMKMHVLNLWREDFFDDGFFHSPAVFLMMKLVFQSMILFTSENTLGLVIGIS